MVAAFCATATKFGTLVERGYLMNFIQRDNSDRLSFLLNQHFYTQNHPSHLQARHSCSLN